MGEKMRQVEAAERSAAGGGLLVTSAEAAALLGMSVRGFLRAVKRSGGTVKPHPASGKLRKLYSRARVLAWAEEETVEEPGPEGGEA